MLLELFEDFDADDLLNPLNHSRIQHLLLFLTGKIISLQKLNSSFRTKPIGHIDESQELMFVVIDNKSKEVRQESVHSLHRSIDSPISQRTFQVAHLNCYALLAFVLDFLPLAKF
jgi:hypothetical protein